MLIFLCIYCFIGGIIGSFTYHIMMGAFSEHTPKEELEKYSKMSFLCKIAIAVFFAALWPPMIIFGWYKSITKKEN